VTITDSVRLSEDEFAAMLREANEHQTEHAAVRRQ